MAAHGITDAGSEEVWCPCVVGYLWFATTVLTGFTVSVTAGGTVAMRDCLRQTSGFVLRDPLVGI